MQPLLLSAVAARLGGELLGDADPLISGAAGLGDAGPGELSFIADRGRLAEAAASGAEALIVGPGMEPDRPAVLVDDPHAAFASFLELLQTPLDRLFPPGVHETAVIHPEADVSAAAAVGPHCVLGAGVVLGPGTRLGPLVTLACDVTVGADCRLHAQVAVREGCRLGDRVVVHSGAVIGTDGFGYLGTAGDRRKVPQVGIVEIGDDVEIGAAATIDRATVGRTVIGAGTKIDNQVQIAHNVRIGRGCALSAQTGVAGSCTLGDGVIAGGQVGIADHLKVGDGARIGAQSGVIKDIEPGATVFGYPALDFQESFRVTAALRRLPGALRKLRELERGRDKASGGSGDE